MSDREGNSSLPPIDDDLSLPKATVAKMIAGMPVHPFPMTLLNRGFVELLPPEVGCAKDTRDLVIECCVGEIASVEYTSELALTWPGLEFIHLISSEANEICEQESKKTIAPEHIIAALKVCLVISTKWHLMNANVALRD